MTGTLAFWGWLLTALSGAVILGAWLTTPTVRRVRTATGRHRRLPPSLVFSHVTGAVSGLLTWIGFLLAGGQVLAWAALALITVTAVLGVTMFVRWIPTYRFKGGSGSAGYRMTFPRGGRHRAGGRIEPGRHRAPPTAGQRNLPLAAVIAHGLLAVTTVLLLVLTVVRLAD